MYHKSSITNAENRNRSWHVIDAQGQTLGRIATKASSLLIGKGKPDLNLHSDDGDFVVIINVAQIRVTGHKIDDKMYHKHSGYMGGIKSESYKTMFAQKPEWLVSEAIRGMLPKNKLGTRMLKRLRIYSDSTHPHGELIKSA